MPALRFRPDVKFEARVFDPLSKLQIGEQRLAVFSSVFAALKKKI